MELYIYTYVYILVGGFNPSEKYEVSRNYYSQYMKNIKRSKPPIRLSLTNGIRLCLTHTVTGG
jgi:hypothetical protein